MTRDLSTIERLSAALPQSRVDLSSTERSRLLRDVLDSSEPSAEPRVARRLLVSVGAASAAAALGFAAVNAGGAPTPIPAADRSAARVVALDQVRLAMSASSSYLVHLRSEHGNGVVWESWHDEATGHSRSVSATPDGTPLYDHEFTPTEEGLHVKVVSHGDRAWWEYTAPGERVARVGPSPDEVRAQIADGTLREVGREAGVGGGEWIRFRSEGSRDQSKLARPFDLWVDASTYLPARLVTEQPGRQPIVTSFEWLPRDQQDASLHAPVPDGFTRLERAPESPAHAETKG